MLALGADAVLVGRDVIRAAIGGGELGVKMQTEHLLETLKTAMLMTGCPNLKSVGKHVFNGQFHSSGSGRTFF